MKSLLRLVRLVCHHGSRKVLTQGGEWATPILFGVVDDRSRLAGHLQWYLAETAEVIAHGLSQAFQKRGLPRSALSDNGAAMTATEITQGLARLGIRHHPYGRATRASVPASRLPGNDADKPLLGHASQEERGALGG